MLLRGDKESLIKHPIPQTPLVEPARRGFYRPELDAMRWFAFLCVFFHHALTRSSLCQLSTAIDLRSTFTTSLKLAVSLFFLLSGYLITTLLTIEKETTGRLHLLAFYKRRIARIWPLYYCFTLLALLAGATIPRVSLPSGYALAAFTFFSGNWYLVHGSVATGALGILWSVNVEEQIYLLWPFAARCTKRSGLVVLSSSLIAAAYTMLLWLGVRGRASDVNMRFNTLVELQFFAAGALLAMTLPRNGISMRLILRFLLAMVGLSCWAAGTFFFGDMAASARWWMPSALYGCVLAGCVAVFLSFWACLRGGCLPQSCGSERYPTGFISIMSWCWHSCRA